MSVIVYSKPSCPSCVNAKRKLKELNVDFEEKTLGVDVTPDELFEIFDAKNLPRPRTAPQIFVNDKHVGGYEALMSYIEDTGFNGTGYAPGN